MAINTTYVDDWKSWEQREDITLRVQNPSPGVYINYTITADGGGAKRRAINRREIRESNGAYTGREMVWLIPNQNLPIGAPVPRPGDLIFPAGDNTFTILEVKTGRWGTTHRCITHFMNLHGVLSSTATISRPSTAKDSSGRQALISYTDLYTNIACRIQPMDSKVEIVDGRRTIPKQYNAIFTVQLGAIQAKDKVVSDGITYTVVGYQFPQSINEFMQLTLERVG